jgi:hypothetical protein
MRNVLTTNNVAAISSEVQAWQLGDKEVVGLSRMFREANGINIKSGPTVQTAENCGAAVMMTQSVVIKSATNDVGEIAEFDPRLNEDTVDLYARLVSSELADKGLSIQTNLAVAVRVQLTNGAGVFLVRTNDKKFRGVLISLALQPRKK